MAQTIETRNSVRAQKNSHADGIKGSRLKLVDTLYQNKTKKHNSTTTNPRSQSHTLDVYVCIHKNIHTYTGCSVILVRLIELILEPIGEG